MANAMVSVPSSDLGPLGWNAVTKRQLFLQRVSSKLGPNARQQGRGPRQDKGPAGPVGQGATAPGSGLSGRRSPGPRQAPGEGSTSREHGQSTGPGSPTRAKQSLTQGHGESCCFLFTTRHENRRVFIACCFLRLERSQTHFCIELHSLMT